MRVAALHLDNALLEQPGLTSALRRANARGVDARDLGPSVRLWGREKALEVLTSRIRDGLSGADAPELVFAGSGDFHHVTALLVARAAEACPRPLTVVHFDNHPDWVKFAGGMHCGSWVGRVARLPGIAGVVTVGLTSADMRRPAEKGADLALVTDGRVRLFPYRSPDASAVYRLCGREWPTISGLGKAGFIHLLLQAIDTNDVYVTIDKDVLRPGEAVTNWDQGELSLETLLDAIIAIGAARHIAGADIVGDYSTPVYGGNALARAFKRAEALMDQPWQRNDASEAVRLNDIANTRLLDTFMRCA